MKFLATDKIGNRCRIALAITNIQLFYGNNHYFTIPLKLKKCDKID